MKQLIAKFIADEQGQDIIEYALSARSFRSAPTSARPRSAAAYNTWFDGHRRRRGRGRGQGHGRRSVVHAIGFAAAFAAARSDFH